MPLQRLTLEDLAREVGDAQTLEEVARPLLQLLQQITGLESTYVTRIDWQGDEQQVIYANNTGTLNIPESLRVPWGDTLCRRALDEGRACTTDVPAVWGDSEAARALGLKTYVSVPIWTGADQPFGTLCGASSKADPVPDSALTVLRLFARLLADQIQRQARYDEERLRAEQMEAYSDALRVIANLTAAANDANALAEAAGMVTQEVCAYANWLRGECWRYLADQSAWGYVTPSGPEVRKSIPALITHAFDSRQTQWQATTASVDLSAPLVAVPLPPVMGYTDGGVMAFYGDRAATQCQYLDAVLEVAAHQLAHVLERQLMLGELKQVNEQLARQATHDALTGLPNRRYLEQHLDRLLAHSRRSGEQVTLAFIDLDGFKQINDQFGHDAGDAVLIEVGQRLTRLVRNGDLAVRLGGDEFVLVTSSKPLHDMHALLRERIEAALTGLASPQFPGACLRGGSVGLVSPTGSETCDALLKRADQLMYEQKQQRRSGR